MCRRRARGENNGDGSAWDDRKGSLYTSSRSSFFEVEKEGAVRSTRPSSTAMTAAFQRRRTTQPCTQRPTVPLRQHPSAVPYTAALFFCLLNVKGGTRDQGARRYSIDNRAARKRAPEFREACTLWLVRLAGVSGVRYTLTPQCLRIVATERRDLVVPPNRCFQSSSRVNTLLARHGL